MARLVSLFVILGSMLLAGCASSQGKGILNVKTPSGKNEYVVQVDSIVKVVKGDDNPIDLDSGDYRVRVSYVGHTVVDTMVHVKGKPENAEWNAWMGGMAVGTGLMTLVWTKAWLFLVPITVSISTFLITFPEKTVVNAVYKNEEPLHLYKLDQSYMRVHRLHLMLGASEKHGVTGVINSVGVCNDAALQMLWVQSDENSLVYPLDIKKDVEMCVLENGSLYCDASQNQFFEKLPCQ